ncbi:glycogen/starch/alpha-glucan phosphorylase [Haloimpatiens sp. FM7330]|uniref:glycogen/starch/alpha-glucan phosphorylase n=1 Tax=Haloimpatiens sp. FM7330 TaxID=3298610 RepID=UPI00363970E3
MHLDKDTIIKDFKRKLMVMYAEDVKEASIMHKYYALGGLIKEYCSKNWLRTNKLYSENKVKQVYYFSMEFLMGKLLISNLISLGIKEVCEDALKELDIDLRELEDVEKDAGLGNGGLGRLAAGFLDSMASLKIPGNGNGIRYKYGLFEQKIVDGRQVEVPDRWLKEGYVWETRKHDKAFIVRFGGDVRVTQEDGRFKIIHENYEPILAVPYDVPIIGYNNDTVNTLRLWSAEAVDKDFDFVSFSNGNYVKAVEYKYSVEAISQVLYPDDSNEKGKLLRLKQEYFFVSAGVQSIVRKYKKLGLSMEKFNEYIAIHINDTHPALAIPELMRILVDEENMPWEKAWDITIKTISFTNHTILSEAMEKWKLEMFKKLLPRIYMIIEEINRRFCGELFDRYEGDWNKINKMSIIQDGYIRMAYLSIVGSHSVNGVAELHTEILKNVVFKEFNDFYTHKFNNKTNGITHRRWLLKANPHLAKLISNTIGNNWIREPNKLIKLKRYSKDRVFQEKLLNIKQSNKIELSNFVKQNYGISIDPNSIFDVQAKRLHEYKRQLLNVFNIMNLYNRVIENPNLDIVPRTFFFGAKASPGYYMAKEIIKLINAVGNRINNDKRVKDKIKVVFLENYRVSLAEKLIPCANVSEQISTASKEASGTGNMKFMMNGAVTIATLDGANIEIKEAVGEENIVLFGLRAEEVINYYKNGGYSSIDIYEKDKRLKNIIQTLKDGFLDSSNVSVSTNEFDGITNKLLHNNDEFFVLKDFDAYVRAQSKIDMLYKNQSKWQEMSAVNIACSGRFSSDNTIKEYAKNVWGV